MQKVARLNDYGKFAKQMQGIMLAIVLGGVFYFALSEVLDENHRRLVSFAVILICLWSNQALPLGVVSLLPLVFMPLIDLGSLEQVSVNYSKPVIFLFLGGFMLALGVEQTGLHRLLAHKMLNFFPATAKGMIFAMLFSSGLLSSFLSNTSTTLLLLPLGLCLSGEPKLQGRFALSIAYGASIGGIMTPLGSPPNLVFYGFMESQGLAVPSFINWVSLVAPLSILMLIFAGFILSRGLEKVDLVTPSELTGVSTGQQKMIFILIGLSLLLVLNAPVGSFPGIGLNEKILLLAFGLLLFLPGVAILDWEQTRRIPYEIIFLFGAGFALADAMVRSGLTNELITVLNAVSQLPTTLILIFAAMLVTLASEVIGNTALISLMLPVLYSLATVAQVDSSILLLVGTICSSYAFMLPIATPPNAIAMSSGVVSTNTMVRYGIILNIVGVVLICFAAEFYWRYHV